MRLFLYEYITGGGFLDVCTPPPPSLLREGAAMIAALAADAAAMANAEVAVMRDARYANLDGLALPGCQVHQIANPVDEQREFRELAAWADRTVLIAPEFDDILHTRAQVALEAGARLASPSPELIALAADKDRTARHLSAGGVPVPQGQLLAPFKSLPRKFDYPAVLKRLDGCGSLGVEYVSSADAQIRPNALARRLERFCPGMPASVAAICGPAGCILLPPCGQHLTDQRSFEYVGGSLPLADELAERATSLARRGVATLPDPIGYIGFDLVLGDDPSGSGDVVIEINPRLTTSYIGLRAAFDANLVAAMLEAAEGRQVSLPRAMRPVQFDSDGTVRHGT